MKALTPALGTHPGWCDEKACDTRRYPDGTVETTHTQETVGEVETELRLRQPLEAVLSRIDYRNADGTTTTCTAVVVDGPYASFSLTAGQAVRVAWLLLRAAARLRLGR
ncbi:DUF6907 domain-containing protein [Pseudonocardia dioxanivorans]|uniref:DUF6907 domain-containing protein n=1 Tax=Pseudonocardia dioxanivorans TaxID=240495 RepID=UPI000CD020B8|nr:hypothetical protein [Pseudonocardia dioxanivorans]